MKRQHARQWRGFTLIELLVVVAIITLLIAILLPSLGKARERAKLVVCQTHLRGWGQGFLMYSEDNSGRLPLDGGDGTTSAPIGAWSDTYLWFNGVVPYVAGGNKMYTELQTASINNGAPLPKGGANSLFVCPSATDAAPAAGDGSSSADKMTADGYFATTGWYSISPVFAETRSMLLCYGMNSQLRDWDMGDPTYDTPRSPDRPGPLDISKLIQLRPSSLVPLVAEKRIRPDELSINDPNYKTALTQSKVTANRFSARHNKGGSIVFADGHVEWFLNSAISNPQKAIKANNYNMPGLIIWNPMNVGGVN